MVIVTQNQYIQASRIHSVVLNEESDWVEVQLDRRTISIKEFKYNINIIYSPDSTQGNGVFGSGHSSGRDEFKECVVTLRGKVAAYKVYKDLVNQIREQMPDALFLDKALENLLNQEEIVRIKTDEDLDKEQEEKQYDAIANAIRRVREAKRTGKKVLRRAKRSKPSSSKRSRR